MPSSTKNIRNLWPNPPGTWAEASMKRRSLINIALTRLKFVCHIVQLFFHHRQVALLLSAAFSHVGAVCCYNWGRPYHGSHQSWYRNLFTCCRSSSLWHLDAGI
ncbi:hypothetical protein VFPBJ_11272 [Purpureocillium lilacinum]|uniref:Uncharacterized protein n=1 Tax=Purpureocillium lilacinum TaxID=33203 RepID=A0A179FET6_PURLI|nr:hypothetical protein VFPBJ_11272 [Purpureocillium lilacinum]